MTNGLSKYEVQVLLSNRHDMKFKYYYQTNMIWSSSTTIKQTWYEVQVLLSNRHDMKFKYYYQTDMIW